MSECQSDPKKRMRGNLFRIFSAKLSIRETKLESMSDRMSERFRLNDRSNGRNVKTFVKIDR